MLLSCELRRPMEKRHPSISVSRSRTPKAFMPSGDTAYSSWTTPMWRNPRVALLARFLSCKQRPSCAIEGTLPIGISWLAPTVNHCTAHETWSHAVVRCPKTHHCHYGLLPLPVAPSQDA